MKKRNDGTADLDEVLARVGAAVAGLHELLPPQPGLPPGAPLSLGELYVVIGGGRIFLESLVIWPPQDVAQVTKSPARWAFATDEEQVVACDGQGRIWQWDDAFDQYVPVASRLDRWLWGALDAYSHVYDHEGEYLESAFDEEGELTAQAELAQCKARLKRDAQALMPRYRLGQLLVEAGDLEAGRRELERCVELDASFPWAWLELARISEGLGELRNAHDEVQTAAEAAVGDTAGYLWSHAARLAAKLGDEPARSEAASKVQRLAPALRSAQIAGIRECASEGAWADARLLIEHVRAVWPKDLELLTLARQVELEAAKPTAPADATAIEPVDVGDEADAE